jgi:hypothetical protein
MKAIYISLSILTVLNLSGLTTAYSQDLPKSQPKLVTIIREQVKVGRAAEHAKHEAGWPAAYEKAKSPDYYVAISSMTGPPEAWYLVPWESHAAEAEALKRENKDPVLSAELASLAARDAEFIHSSTVIQAVARPDLTIGAFPDISKARFFQIGVYLIRPGKTQKFDDIVRLYNKIRLKAAPKSSYRVYSVMTGMPSPAYIVISSVEDYADFDQVMSEDMATVEQMTDDEKAKFEDLSEIVLKEEYNRYRVEPQQSYVPKEVREKDPEFWMAK